MRATSPALLTSARTAAPPSSVASFSTPTPSTSASTRRAPPAARRRAVAAPMPRAAPVMSTLRPSRCAMDPPHEPADDLDRARGLVEHRQEPVPDMDHRRPFLQCDLHAGRLRALPEATRVVEQHLVAADLHQQRRQIVQTCVERRDQRRLAIAAAHIRLRHSLDALARDDGIDGRPGEVARGAVREIHPWRDADAAGRPRQPAIAQREQRRHRQSAARRVAGHDDAPRRDPLREQPLVGGDGVLQRGRERMLRRQPVVEQQRARPGRARDGGGQVTMRARRADHVPAAVQVEHDGVGPNPGRRQPFRRARGRRDRLDLHVRRRREDALGALVLGAPLLDGERVRRRQLRQVLADEMNTSLAHGATWYAKRSRRTSRATVRPMAHKGMAFGIFLAPFHRLGENPTLALSRDMELIEWLDWLGYDEVWVGEHHSAGWELIASPEIFIAAAAERTRHIRLGSGVTSLPYHHPFLVAQRFVQLDHMTRGRTMLGCGPGALVSDAYMMGIEPVTQRPRMDEALDAIMLLLKCEEPVTLKTDWFELRQARLHLAPYTEPHFPIAVASVMTPSGVIAAGRHGLGVLSLGAGVPGGPEALANQWKIGEETAAKHGKTMDRKNWKLVVNVHVAEDDEEAMRQVKRAERHETITYFEETLGRPPGRSDDPLTDGVKMGTTLVGSVETVVKGIEKLWELSNGGFGGLLFRAHNWANRQQTLHSYELFARYVMPRFQGTADGPRNSNEWARGNRKTIFSPNVEAIRRAYTDAGREIPADFLQRASGSRDIEGTTTTP